MKYISTIISLFLFALLSQTAISKKGFQNYIPNGGVNSCLNCHFSLNGGSRNVFGKDAQKSMSNDKVNWDKLFNLDSDGDGFTNGEELQDINGKWSIGNPEPGNTALVTNPSDPNSKPATSSVENDIVSLNTSVYPSPTIGILNFEFISNYFDISTIEIYNTNGNFINSIQLETIIGSNTFSINLNDLGIQQGIYSLVIRNKYYNIRKRFVFIK